MLVLDGRALEGLSGVALSDQELERIALPFNPQVCLRHQSLTLAILLTPGFTASSSGHCMPHSDQMSVYSVKFPPFNRWHSAHGRLFSDHDGPVYDHPNLA